MVPAWYKLNEISVGELFSFVLYTTFIGASIAGLGDIYTQIQRLGGASERVLEILIRKKKKDTCPHHGIT